MFIIHPLMVLFMSVVAACRLADDAHAFDFHDDGFIECELDPDGREDR